MHKLYNQATWQVGPKPETQEIDRDRDRDGRGDKEGEGTKPSSQRCNGQRCIKA